MKLSRPEDRKGGPSWRGLYISSLIVVSSVVSYVSRGASGGVGAIGSGGASSGVTAGDGGYGEAALGGGAGAVSPGPEPVGYSQPASKAQVWFERAKAPAFAATRAKLVEGALPARREAPHARWVVVTTINAPTDAIKKLAALPDWRVVVVGDTKTPANWAWPNVTYLSVAEQLSLGFSTTQLIKTRAYQRKNLGYLYAVQHGAEVIYETDDDNALTLDHVPVVPGSQSSDASAGTAARVLEFVSAALTINHHAHFGQPSTWPRGYPLEAIGEPHVDMMRESPVAPAVQQGLADGDPDMDAIFRLTRKPVSRRIDFSFEAAPPVALPFGSFGPYNAQNTVFTRAGLWATVLPQTVEFRVCDIWRAYFTQRLLWGTGAQLAFIAPYVYQLRNAHTYHADYVSEKQIFDQVTQLLTWLRAWECPLPERAAGGDGGKAAARSLPHCAYELAKAFATEGYWGAADAELVRHFMHDLQRAGYAFPAWLEAGAGQHKRACEAPGVGGCGVPAGAAFPRHIETRPSIELFGSCGAPLPPEAIFGRKALV